jgi:hypothetical protein
LAVASDFVALPFYPRDMRLFDDTASVPASAIADIEYIVRGFRPLDPRTHELVSENVLPRATYVLPDGTPMVPSDHAELLAAGGGDGTAVKALFTERFLAAGGDEVEVEQAYDDWLTGEFGACLHSTLPESIVAKGGLTQAIAALLAHPREDDQDWRGALRGSVDALDALERAFAAFDRERFGGPVSRDRLVTATRERFGYLWS